jgi:hypothetical protein
LKSVSVQGNAVGIADLAPVLVDLKTEDALCLADLLVDEEAGTGVGDPNAVGSAVEHALLDVVAGCGIRVNHPCDGGLRGRGLSLGRRGQHPQEGDYR